MSVFKFDFIKTYRNHLSKHTPISKSICLSECVDIDDRLNFLIWRNFFMELQCVLFLLLLSIRSKKQCTILFLQKEVGNSLWLELISASENMKITEKVFAYWCIIFSRICRRENLTWFNLWTNLVTSSRNLLNW